MTKVMKLGMVIGTVECYPCSSWKCFEFETCSLELTLALRCMGDFDSFLSCKSLDRHGSMAAILGISNSKCEVVGFVGHCPYDLGNGTFSPSNQLNCSKSWGDWEVLWIYVFHWFEGLNDPSREWWDQVLLLGKEEDPSWEVLEHVWASFISSIFS